MTLDTRTLDAAANVAEREGCIGMNGYGIAAAIRALAQSAVPVTEEGVAITLASLRKASGLSLRAVRDATGGRVSDALLSQYETGKIKRPSATVLVDLASVYGVPVNTVFEAADVNSSYVTSEDEPRSDRYGRQLATWALHPQGEAKKVLDRIALSDGNPHADIQGVLVVSVDHAITAMLTFAARASSERERRLVEALERIAADRFGVPHHQLWEISLERRDIARAALGGTDAE